MSEHRPAHVARPSSDRSRRRDVDVRRVGAVLLPPLLVGTAISTVVVIVVAIFQLRAYVLEYQGPLDHARTALLVPYYGMRCRCPPFSIYDAADTAASYDGDGGGRYDSSRDSNRTTALSSCDGDVDVRRNGGGGGPRENDRIVSNGGGGGASSPPISVPFPRIFMIGARDETEDTFRSWYSLLHHHRDTSKDNVTSRDDDDVGSGSGTSRRSPFLERIYTLEISNRYALGGGATLGESTTATKIDNDHPRTNTTSNAPPHDESDGGRRTEYLCRKIKWEHRLFAVYQRIFADLLSTYPNDEGFVIVEDDAVLKDAHSFVREACYAHVAGMEFYSLYRSPAQRRSTGRGWGWGGRSRQSSFSCIYVHGTVAFYVRRSIMERVANERRRAHFCRFPIDMYISRLGPWFATGRDMVGHSDGGRVGSTGL